MGLDYGTISYVPTNAYSRYDLELNTNQGVVKFDVWDTCGQEKPGKLREEYYRNSHAAILMFALSSKMTFQPWMDDWDDDLGAIAPKIPKVLIGNCADETPHKVREHSINRIVRKRELHYIQMSAKNDQNPELAMPFLHLAEILMGMGPGTLHLIAG